MDNKEYLSTLHLRITEDMRLWLEGAAFPDTLSSLVRRMIQSFMEGSASF